MLDKGFNINSFNEDGKTAILLATEQNHPNLVKWLLKKGANIDLFDKSRDFIDKTPFLFAGANGLNEILDILIPYNPDVNIVNGYGGNALIPACERGHVDTVMKLLNETDVNVNLVNNLGWTALLESIILSDGGKNHQKIVKLLLKHGADQKIADGKGKMPLDHAKEKNFKEIVKFLEN